MIDKNSPIPIYYQLKQLIKKQVESGSFSAGDQLPTEQALSERYHISRAPIRQAFAELVQEGYIYRRSGQGTFVAERHPARRERLVTLDLLAYDVRWVTLLEQAVRRWNDLHPHRELRLSVTMPSQEDFHQILCNSVGSGTAPDIVSIDYVWIARYARMGFLAALDEVTPTFAARLIDDLEAPVLASNTLDGHLYGLPIQADLTGMWYRRSWFEAEGLKIPESWEEWEAALAHFHTSAAKAHYGHRAAVAFPVSTHTGEATLNVLVPLLWSAGGELVDAEGKVALDSEANRKTLTFLRRIGWERGYLPEDVAAFHWWSSPRLLGRGAVPMIAGGTYEWPVISEESGWESEAEVARHLCFAPVPRPTADDAPMLSLGGTTWVIPRQSQHPDLVAEVLQLAMEPEVLLRFCEQELQISTLKSMNRRLQAPDHPWMRQVVPLLAHARPRPMMANYVQLSRFVQQMFEQVLTEGLAVDVAVKHTNRTLQLLLGE